MLRLLLFIAFATSQALAGGAMFFGGNRPTTTPLSSITAHNGVACIGPNLLKSWCYSLYNSGDGFPGWTNDQSDTADPVITNPVHPIPSRISDVGYHTLFPGWNTLILAECQCWFSAPNSGSPSTTTFDGETYDDSGGHLMNGAIDGEMADSVETIGGATASQLRASAMVRYWYTVGIDGTHLVNNGNPEGCGQNGSTVLSGASPYDPATTTWNRDCGNSTVRKRAGYFLPKLLWSMQNLDGGAYTGMKILPMYEESAWKTDSQCGTEDDNQVKCVQSKRRSDIQWLISTLLQSPQAAVALKSGKEQPVISQFLSESILFGTCNDGSACATLGGSTCTTRSSCWMKVFDEEVPWYATQSITRNGSTYAFNPWLLFRDAPGLAHNESGGGFLWIPHNNATGASITTATQEDWKGDDRGTPSMAGEFYNEARCSWSVHSWCTSNFPTYKDNRLVVGSLYKGFDARFAAWKRPDNEITSQRCGQTLLDSATQVSAVNANIGTANFGPGTPPFALAVNTWDDYEEGTAVEPGIDNCYTVTRALVTNTLSWALSSADPFADSSTISHWAIWISSDGGTNFRKLNGNVAVGTLSLNITTALAGFNAGTYNLRVQAIGKPGIMSKISSAISYVK